MTAIPTIVQKTVPFKSIFIPDDNYRQGELPDIDGMAESLKRHGQLEPVIVAKGGPDGYDFTLVGGDRRLAGFVKNRWQSRDVLVTVRTYAKDDVFGPIFDNVASNEETRSPSPYDRAVLCHQLVTGTHPRAEGHAMDRKEVEKRLHVEPSLLGKLLKIARNIDPKVAKKAKAKDASFRFFIKLAAVVGEGDTEEDKLADRTATQAVLVEEWIATQKALAEAGRTRAAPEPKTAARKQRGQAGEPEEDEEAPAEKRARTVGAKPVDAKKRTGEFYLRALQLKVTTVTAQEALKIQGAIAATAFFTGQKDRMEGLLTEKDLQAVERADKAAEKAIAIDDENEAEDNDVSVEDE